VTTKPNREGNPMDENEQIYQAFVTFLRTLTTATDIAEVNAAAGALLQDLGEEPS